MTYESSEVSVHSAKPVELFKFIGTYASFYYTSASVAITFLGNNYLPIAIKRSDVRSGTQEDDGLDVTVEMPVSVPMVQTYAFATAPPKLDLTIYRYHRSAPGDFVAYWTGPVNNIQVSGGRATLRSPSALAQALVGSIPNVYYQSPCNHVLYDARCKVLEGNFSVATTATVVNGKSITVDSIGTLTGMLVGGELRNAAGERRMITGQVANVLTVNFPFATLAPAGAVTLVAGCDHAYLGDCLSRFNNQINFGGFPFIPNENVFQEGMEPAKVLADNTCLPPTFNPVFEGWYVEVLVQYDLGQIALSDPGWIWRENGAHIVDNSHPIGPNNTLVEWVSLQYFRLRTRYPESYNVQGRNLQLQFGSGTNPGGLGRARVTCRRWDTQFAGATLPLPGSESEGDPFPTYQLFPGNWYFEF